MQFTSNHNALKRKFYFILQVAVTLGALVWIAVQLAGTSWEGLIRARDIDWLKILLIVILMPVNWLLEAVKWQVLLRRQQSLTMMEACRSVIHGLMLTWVIPFTLGDVVGRLQYADHKLSASRSILWSRGASLAVALAFGMTGLLAYFWDSLSVFYFVAVILVLLVAGLGLLWAGHKSLAWVLGFSAMRYWVMATQLFLSLTVFTESPDELWMLAGVTWVFLFRSVLPSLWGAMGVREVSAVVFFQCCVPLPVIISATMLIWVVNLVLPSVLYAAGHLYRLLVDRPLTT